MGKRRGEMFKKNSYEQNDCLFNEQTPKQILIDLRKEVAESLIHPF